MSMHPADLVEAYREAVADWTRQHAVWAATAPGTADANMEERTLHRMMRRAMDLEDELERRMAPCASCGAER